MRPVEWSARVRRGGAAAWSGWPAPGPIYGTPGHEGISRWATGSSATSDRNTAVNRPLHGLRPTRMAKAGGTAVVVAAVRVPLRPERSRRCDRGLPVEAPRRSAGPAARGRVLERTRDAPPSETAWWTHGCPKSWRPRGSDAGAAASAGFPPASDALHLRRRSRSSPREATAIKDDLAPSRPTAPRSPSPFAHDSRTRRRHGRIPAGQPWSPPPDAR